MFGADSQIKQRLEQLENHLATENPLLVNAVQEFRKLDKVGYRMGLLARDESYANQIPWWPLISVLGTFSAGKSTFINHYLNTPLQETGTQAVDDKFTVICYSAEKQARVLPGISLEADPRFPFYHMADVLEKVCPGASDRINTYMQMKTCPDIKSKGRIFIDSPGFDADDQRTETLKITDYIIDLSDLVLIFFDARHPEPGAMRDTLKHLVADKIYQKNADKFVYILNQIDATVREDNPEDVIASWQRALSAEGLTAGKFYTIYNPDAAVVIEDEVVRKRFEQKRDTDLNKINDLIAQIDIDRVYRIIGALDKTAREIEHEKLPKLISMLSDWRRSVLRRDAFVIAAITLIIGALMMASISVTEVLLSLVDWASSSTGGQLTGALVAFSLLLVIHFTSRKYAGIKQLKKLMTGKYSDAYKASIKRAFIKNTQFFHSIIRPQVIGWGYFSKNTLKKVKNQADLFIQKLNDQFAMPSGKMDTKNVDKEVESMSVSSNADI
ncbi:MAG: dynamin family protein [endosymbiont of Galathealinum brachiosum]|uniref:Dynamin family protein n=1 Tax=endosymbiont of Galathealinum brachiosum TaxID=2200906 RepID=A0A370DD45_9GAMM|nr:MAG: dynamin family protein [endosymbiont of Galathealinum brachiosum]